ncbi:MAG: hypothetical protein K940chlam9_00002 [Chlamydiae bacterium]|nr:hypothetical protein [Chlamydiota bacterium]
MENAPFYGREEELKRLKGVTKKKSASLVVIRGRRRIGKSRLILEFSKKMKAKIFTGLPPVGGVTAAQDQREYFAKQMEQQLPLRAIKGEDWADLFWLLAKETKKGQLLLVFDEINWMGSEDPTFLGKLKSAWDLHFKNNPNLILILSGSMSGWIEQNILSSTGFMGRISLDLTLDELPLHVCNLFWRNHKDELSAYEKFKILSVTGGVPLYLEEIDPCLSAEENIQQLAFQRGALLVEEFDRIFSDLFSHRSHRYKMIVKRLAQGNADLGQICEAIEMEKGGTVSEYLEDLVETGYVARDFTWSLKSGKESILSKFRLKDNYIRFYLKYIEPNLHQIEKNRISRPPAWSTIMGLQFENLVLHNINQVLDIIKIAPEEIVYDSPYFQKATKTHPGCQIDYMIQNKYNTLYIFEIKFSKQKIDTKVIQELEQKIHRLQRPKHFSYRPILVHVNGVTDTLLDSDYFAHTIDFSQFLQP